MHLKHQVYTLGAKYSVHVWLILLLANVAVYNIAKFELLALECAIEQTTGTQSECLLLVQSTESAEIAPEAGAVMEPTIFEPMDQEVVPIVEAPDFVELWTKDRGALWEQTYTWLAYAWNSSGIGMDWTLVVGIIGLLILTMLVFLAGVVVSLARLLEHRQWRTLYSFTMLGLSLAFMYLVRLGLAVGNMAEVTFFGLLTLLTLFEFNRGIWGWFHFPMPSLSLLKKEKPLEEKVVEVKPEAPRKTIEPYRAVTAQPVPSQGQAQASPAPVFTSPAHSGEVVDQVLFVTPKNRDAETGSWWLQLTDGMTKFWGYAKQPPVKQAWYRVVGERRIVGGVPYVQVNQMAVAAV
jgi:hypothetical protein